MLPYGIFFAIFFYLPFFHSFFSRRWTLKVSWGHQALCHGGGGECKTQFQANPGSLWSQLGGSWGPWLKGDRQRQWGEEWSSKKAVEAQSNSLKCCFRLRIPRHNVRPERDTMRNTWWHLSDPEGPWQGWKTNKTRQFLRVWCWGCGFSLGFTHPRGHSVLPAERVLARLPTSKLSQTRLFWIYKTKRRKSESANWGATEAVLGVLEDW